MSNAQLGVTDDQKSLHLKGLAVLFYVMGLSTDYVEELTYPARKRIHNLKYYTWVEQQGKTYEEIQAQWYQPDCWTSVHGQVDAIDSLIEEFNAKVGLL